MQYNASKLGASNLHVLTATGELGAQFCYYASSLIWLHVYCVKYCFYFLPRDVSDNKQAAKSAQQHVLH